MVGRVRAMREGTQQVLKLAVHKTTQPTWLTGQLSVNGHCLCWLPRVPNGLDSLAIVSCLTYGKEVDLY